MTVYTVFGQPASPAALTSDTSDLDLGMQFTLSSNAALTGIWFYSAPGAGSLPVGCCIYQVTGTGTGSQVAGTVNTSPTWSGIAGSGWVKVTYPGTTTLTAGVNYKVVVTNGFGVNWYSHTASYWASAVTSGIITAASNATADGGQDSFLTSSAGVLGYPTTSFNASNYWVDVEVTTAGGGGSGAGTLTGAGSLTAAVLLRGAVAASGAGTVGGNSAYGSGTYGSGTYGGAGGTGVPVTLIAGASLTGAGSVVAVPAQRSAATLTGAGTLTATAGSGTTVNGTAALAGAGSLAALATQRAAAALTAAGTLTASPGTFTNGTATLTAAGSLTAAGGFTAEATLAAAGTLNVTVTQQAVALLAGLGTLGQEGLIRAASTATVTDPRDGTDNVTARATSISGVT